MIPGTITILLHLLLCVEGTCDFDCHLMLLYRVLLLANIENKLKMYQPTL